MAIELEPIEATFPTYDELVSFCQKSVTREGTPSLRVAVKDKEKTKVRICQVMELYHGLQGVVFEEQKYFDGTKNVHLFLKRVTDPDQLLKYNRRFNPYSQTIEERGD